jgi:hypothetical protein
VLKEFLANYLSVVLGFVPSRRQITVTGCLESPLGRVEKRDSGATRVKPQARYVVWQLIASGMASTL